MKKWNDWRAWLLTAIGWGDLLVLLLHQGLASNGAPVRKITECEKVWILVWRNQNCTKRSGILHSWYSLQKGVRYMVFVPITLFCFCQSIEVRNTRRAIDPFDASTSHTFWIKLAFDCHRNLLISLSSLAQPVKFLLLYADKTWIGKLQC